MANLKIHGGTRDGFTSLCHTCSNSLIRKGSALGQELVVCQATHPNRQITYPIVECSDFYDKSLPSLRAMTDIATFINADKKTGKIGFVSADKADDETKEDIYRFNPFKN